MSERKNEKKRFVLSKQQDDFNVKIIFKNQLDFYFNFINELPPSTSILKRTKVEGGTGAKAGTPKKKNKLQILGYNIVTYIVTNWSVFFSFFYPQFIEVVFAVFINEFFSFRNNMLMNISDIF